MMKLIASICLLAFAFGQTGDRFREYRAVESYEIRPGIIITPRYTANHEVCKISIQKSHYSNNTVYSDVTMSKTQILSMFDELVPREERGQSLSTDSPGVDTTEFDDYNFWKLFRYENVFLEMHGRVPTGTHEKKKWINMPDERQEYDVAVISWTKRQCDVK